MRQPKGKVGPRELNRNLLEQICTKTNDNIYAYYNTVTIDRPRHTIEIPISKFNRSTDIIIIHKNGTYMAEDFDYVFDSNNTHIMRPDDSEWNAIKSGQVSTFEFMVLKNIKKFTKLSEIELIKNSVTEDKFDEDLIRGLIPKGGHKGSYLVKKPGEYNFEWLDFTNVNIVLSSPGNFPMGEVTAKIVDVFSKKEKMITFNGTTANINDLPSGDYDLIVFNNKSFKPEYPSYRFSVVANTQTQVLVNMVERNHEIQLEIHADVDVTNPIVKIRNIFTEELYTFTLEGRGRVISKMISLPSGNYEANVVEDENGLKQITDVAFKLDYRHSVSSVSITVLNRWRLCKLDFNFRPVIDMNNNAFVPMYEEDNINLLNSNVFTKVNSANDFIVNIEILNLRSSESVFKRFMVPKTGLKKLIPIYLENGIPYRIKTKVENGTFSIKGSLTEVAEGVDTKVIPIEIFENAALLKFAPSIENRLMFVPNTKHSTHRYYNIEIYQDTNGDFANATLYQTIRYVKADCIIKVPSERYYRIKMIPDNTLDTRPSLTKKAKTLLLEVGQSAYGSKDIITMEAPYTPIIEYGFKIDPSNSDPNECVHYICDCENYVPSRHVNDSIDLGSWNNTFIVNAVSPVILENGRVTKELDKTNQNAVFNNLNLNEDFKGDFMVRFEKCYYYFKEELSGVIEFRICTVRKSGEYNAFAFESFDGREKDYMYFGMYESSFDNQHLRSLPGKDVKVNSSIQDMGSNIASKGLGYSLEDYSKRLYINCLHVLLSKSLDSQYCFGIGNTDTLKPNRTGITDSFPMFIPGDNRAVKTFYIENLWGNVEEWLQGLVYYKGNFRYKQHGPYSSNPDDYTLADVNIQPSDMQNPSNHIIKKCAANSFGMLPQITNANVNYYNDKGYISTNFPVPTVGGGYDGESGAGLWNMNVFYKWTDANAKVGGRIVFV